MKKKIYRNVICFEILSEDPIEEMPGLSMIDYQASEGEWSGRFLDQPITNQELIGEDAVDAVYEQGTAPEFFEMDEEGNIIEYF